MSGSRFGGGSSTDPDEVGFVICSSCGARIKADREWCLRCHAPLVAWKRPELPLPSWIRAMGGGTMIFGVVALLAIAIVAYVAYDSSSPAGPESSSSAAPSAPVASRPSAAGAPPPAATRSAAASVKRIEPVIFVDAPNRGVVNVTDKDLPATRTRLEQAIASAPDDAAAHNDLGLTLERLGFVETAVGHFARAVEIDRRNWVYHFNLAHAASLKQDWNRAASEYGAAAELFPANFAAQYDLAVALHRSGNEGAAIPAFQKAIELAPGEPAAHLSLAVSLEIVSRTDDAAKEYRRYLDMVPDAEDAPAVRARIDSLSRQP